MNTINRLQFRHHEEVFDTREDAIEYIYDKIKEEGKGLAKDQNSTYSFSLFAEPTILRYKNDDDETDVDFKKGPHIMLVIGSETNDSTYHDRNKFCIIDIDKTEDEIKNLEEELAKAIRSLTLAVLDTNTIGLHVEKTDEGTFLSGDVKTAGTHIFEGVVKENNLMAVQFDDEAGPEGLFIYVDLTYDEPSETFTFIVSQADGTLKRQSVKLPNNYLVRGEYREEDESLHLYMKDGEEIIIDCEKLINEWSVEGEASNTPIVLTREEVDYSDETSEHHHVEPWQDVLRADVRIADDRPANILNKTTDGRCLYVDGVASNIVYYWNGDRSNVKEQLDKLNNIKISQDNDNIIWERADGYFASTTLDYISGENKLILTTSSVNGTPIKHEVQLNTVEVIESITYDPVNETLVIKYKNDKGETKTVVVPIRGLIDEWEVLNDAHSVKLVKQRNVSGKDILTADVNISSMENNILEERGEGNIHALFVKGTADNIKYKNTTVESALDSLAAEDEDINDKLNQEIARSTAEDEKIETTIGTGFSTDTHETVTYKFEQLSEKVDLEANKLQNEIDRSTGKDEELENTLNQEIERATGVEHTLHDEIEAVSADSASSLKSISNVDKSINVDEIDAVNPVIKVNISSHENNTIRLIQQEGVEGLFNFVDLVYDSEHNKLTFTRSTSGSTDYVKEMQLQSVSFIDDIYYDKDTEELVIVYYSGHERKEMRIPMRDLIDEWDIYNDVHSAVVLTKTWDSDLTKNILSAEVKISDKTDNILENQEGELYVSNSGITANADAIAEETQKREEAISALSGAIDTEKSERESGYSVLSEAISAETSARTADTYSLSGAIGTGFSVENSVRKEINDILTPESTNTVTMSSNAGKLKADVKLESNESIIKIGNGGIYATVRLNYSAGTNTLQLVTSNGEQEVIQLAGVTFIDRCYYDSVNKNIVIVYKDGQGQEHTTTIGVSDLLNEWDVNNDGTPIKLTKTIATSGGIDTLKANVKLSEHDDNLLTIDGDALYVPGDIVASATTIAECVSGKTDSIYKTLFGDAAPGGCGEGIEYKPDVHNCIISAATSFQDADQLMAYQLCEILEMWVSGMTCTSISNWVDDGANKKMLVDVRGSHGKGNIMTDDDIYITDCNAKLVETGVTEFTDTNVLRIVCLERCDGSMPDVADPQNGIYLSNVWDCGKYYQESTEAEEIAEVKASGYNTNYLTDESSEASDYKYNNNVRQ